MTGSVVHFVKRGKQVAYVITRAIAIDGNSLVAYRVHLEGPRGAKRSGFIRHDGSCFLI